MELISGKVAGHFVLQNSDWFTIHEKITTITAPTGSGKSTLLKALLSINPPFCHPGQAPFAAFPRYVSQGHHTRKVIPAKKTAVITVFICDNELRSSLADIDPVFMHADRIEVGRRLDNSRWVTYVEIAGSSRWSELAPLLDKLRQLFPPAADDSLLGPMWQQCDTLAATDRIKGALATHLLALLDHLAGRAGDEEEQALVQQAGFIVNRASRFMEARKLTTAALPVFLYLEKDNLLSPAIHVRQLAEKMRQSTEIPCSCADLFLLGLLGIDPAFLRQKTAQEIALSLQENSALYASAGSKLGARLMQYLPGFASQSLSVRLADGVITLHMGGQANQPCPAEISSHLRWMLSCAVSACYISEVQGRQPIFLLDEPDAAPGNSDEKNELEAMLWDLSGSCQVVACTTSDDFLANSGKRYRLRQDGEKGYRVY